MQVTIDKNSGYCFGVEYAIQMAEDELADAKTLFCLGDIVHNNMEVERLNKKGLKIIDRDQMKELHDCKVLIRAHGEPPETYQLALKNNIELIDASCPVVLKLQNRIKYSFDKMTEHKGQIVIYGQKGHAEVIGLNGQTNDSSIIVTNEDDLKQVDFTKPISFYSQTTKSTEGFYKMKALIEEKIKEANSDKNNTENIDHFDANDSICRQVSNREPQLEKFSKEHDVVLFVSGKKSSNGKALYTVCKKNNERSFFIENELEIDPLWFNENDSIGICGATSTPMWLMENISQFVQGLDVAVI